MNNDFWTSALVPNPNKTEIPKLILRRVPAPAPGRESSSSTCVPSSPTRTDVQTTPPQNKDFVWTSNMVPNLNHPNSPKMIFRRFPAPRSKGDSSSSSSPSPHSSPSPKQQCKTTHEGGRKVKVGKVKPRRPPGSRRSLQKPTAGTKQPRLVGPRPTWVRNIKAILKERNTQSGKGWRMQPGHVEHKSPARSTSPASSPRLQPRSLLTSGREKETPNCPAGRGLSVQTPMSGTQQPLGFMSNPGQNKGSNRAGGQQRRKLPTKKTSPPASPPKHATLNLLSSSSSSSSCSLSSRSTSPELQDQSIQLEKLLSKKEDV